MTPNHCNCTGVLRKTAVHVFQSNALKIHCSDFGDRNVTEKRFQLLSDKD